MASVCPTCTEIRADLGDLNEREATRILRQMEMAALDGVLHAFRAQGPLSLYKEVLLDHLKTALFCGQDEYIFRVDHVVNDEICGRICEILNPNYHRRDANWLLERQSLHPLDFRRHMSRVGTDISGLFDADTTEERVWSEKHENFQAAEDRAFCKLLSMEKKPFVPEVLRRILVTTEQSERIDRRSTSIATQTDDESTPIEEEDSAVEIRRLTAALVEQAAWRAEREEKIEAATMNEDEKEKEWEEESLQSSPPPRDRSDSRESSTGRSLIEFCATAPPFELAIEEQFPRLKAAPPLSPPPNISAHLAAFAAHPHPTGDPQVTVVEQAAITSFGTAVGRRTQRKRAAMRPIRPSAAIFAPSTTPSTAFRPVLLHFEAAERLAQLNRLSNDKRKKRWRENPMEAGPSGQSNT